MKALCNALLTGFLCCGSIASFAQVRLPAVFSDGMVLQQKAKASIWGWATKGEVVTITANWAGATPISAKTGAAGKWQTTINTPPAGGPYVITVKGTNTLTVNDVLVGEVWLCSGQSNMGFTLKSANKAKEELAAAGLPSIRYFSVKRQYGPKEFDDAPGSVWEKASPQTAGNFSAVAYFFAKRIHQQMGVPVGLLFNAWGGTPAEAWTPSTVITNDTALKIYPHRWADMFKTVGRDSTAYHAALEEWEGKRKTADSGKLKKPQEPATLISFNRPWREPSVLFNGMVCPLIPFGIKGFLWYQGESNVNYADEYVRLFGALIEGWRERWHDKNLPFYFVQIAPFNYADMEAAAKLRDAQQRVAKTVPQTAMVTTVDVGNMADQHPTRKKEVGDRLAAVALHHLYGEKSLATTGPEMETASLENSNVVLRFNKAVTATKDAPPAGFEIGFSDGTDSVRYVPAQAKAENNRIVVWSNSVQRPVAVRYAWLRISEANLAGNDGWPVAPFSIRVNPPVGNKPK